MARATTAETDWVRRSGALTVLSLDGRPTDEVTEAAEAAHRLVDLARQLVTSGALSSDCNGPSCVFVRTPEASRPCTLAWDLASTGIPSIGPLAATAPPGVVADRFLQALAASSGAIFVCRRTLHASGQCLFAGGGAGTDLCGRVLVAAHRLSTAQSSSRPAPRVV
jgi:hypothetical protein